MNTGAFNLFKTVNGSGNFPLYGPLVIDVLNEFGHSEF